MASKFTCFEKFGEVLELFEEDDKKELSYAIMMYGSFGEEIEIESFAVKVAFTSFKEDIDNSKKAQGDGKKGGRPPKKNPPFEPEETPLSQSEKPPLFEKENPPFEKTESQTKPIQANTSQTKPIGVEGVSRKRFTPPTPEQVETYAKSKGHNVDPHRFCDFYASKGWKVGSSPMKDWKAAVRNWASRDPSPQKQTNEYTGVYANDW